MRRFLYQLANLAAWLSVLIATAITLAVAVRTYQIWKLEEFKETAQIIAPANMEPVEADEPFEVVLLSCEVIYEETAAPAYTEADLNTLALIIYQEAGSDLQSDETRQMVGEVVLNRVVSPLYPNSIEAVATQEAQYGTLSQTGLVWPARAASTEEVHAVRRAYQMAEALLSGAVERLLPEDVIFQSEYIQGEVVRKSDGFYFCKR